MLKWLLARFGRQTEKRNLMEQPENTKSRHEMIITLSKTLILLERRTNVRQRSRLLARQTSVLYLFEWFPWLPGEHFCPRLDLSPNLISNDICEGNMSPTREIMMLDCSKKERKKERKQQVQTSSGQRYPRYRLTTLVTLFFRYILPPLLKCSWSRRGLAHLFYIGWCNELNAVSITAI